MYQIRDLLTGFGRMIYYKAYEYETYQYGNNQYIQKYHPFGSPKDNEIIAMYEGHFIKGSA